jgi:hypothetical protein
MDSWRTIMVSSKGPYLPGRSHLATRDTAWIFSGQWTLYIGRDRQHRLQPMLIRRLDGPSEQTDRLAIEAEIKRSFGSNSEHVRYDTPNGDRVLEIQDPATIAQLISRRTCKIMPEIESDLFFRPEKPQGQLFASGEEHLHPTPELLDCLHACGISPATVDCIPANNPCAKDPLAYHWHAEAIYAALGKTPSLTRRMLHSPHSQPSIF